MLHQRTVTLPTATMAHKCHQHDQEMQEQEQIRMCECSWLYQVMASDDYRHDRKLFQKAQIAELFLLLYPEKSK
jgi:hypothetical protein